MSRERGEREREGDNINGGRATSQQSPRTDERRGEKSVGKRGPLQERGSLGTARVSSGPSELISAVR